MICEKCGNLKEDCECDIEQGVCEQWDNANPWFHDSDMEDR